MKILSEGLFVSTILGQLDLPADTQLSDLDSLLLFELLLIVEDEMQVLVDDEALSGDPTWSDLYQTYIKTRIGDSSEG